jgi:hypothetical protein
MGRKTLHEAGMTPVTSRVPAELAETFKLMAEASGKSVSLQLRHLIEGWVATQDADAMIESRRAELEASNQRLRELALQGRTLRDDQVIKQSDLANGR